MNNPTIGPYQLIEELGRGSQTVVYKAWQQGLDRPVALKVLHSYDQKTLKKFEAEARRSAKFNTPGVRRIYEAGQTQRGDIYLAMEYVDNTLRELLRKRKDQKRPFTRAEAARLLAPVAQALDEIHQQGLAHLDIKPENILVSKAGHAMLADFGIARRVGEKTHEGTPCYLSPEQAAGDRPVGPWSDIYSLGAVIYEMVTNHTPFKCEMDMVVIRQHLEDPPPSPRQFNAQLDRDLEWTLLSALNKVPANRPDRAQALIEAVSRKPTPMQHLSMVLKRATGAVQIQPQLALIPLAIIVVVAGLFLAMNRAPTAPTPTTTPPTAQTLTLSPAIITETREPGLGPTSTAAPKMTQQAPETVSDNGTGVITTVEPLILTNPPGGAELEGTMASFAWLGTLPEGSRFIVKLQHTNSGATVESQKLTDNSWTTELDGDKFGEWKWHVEIVRQSDGTMTNTSDTSHFYLKSF
ncbi:MAG: serine/threonine protein kinase [Anaerolineae bacterium]|nr:serine/threonine protein kinase [Anaerolineae bacterium]